VFRPQLVDTTIQCKSNSLTQIATESTQSTNLSTSFSLISFTIIPGHPRPYRSVEVFTSFRIEVTATPVLPSKSDFSSLTEHTESEISLISSLFHPQMSENLRASASLSLSIKLSQSLVGARDQDQARCEKKI
jgi:hypothetical protein